MTVLGIESTCDETAAAVVVDGRRVLSNVIATQFELHEKFRGVVPEIASRAHIENILPVVRSALDDAGIGFDQLDAVAVANRPGLIGSLLVGVTAAKTFAWAIGKPLVGVDHVQAHLYSVLLDRDIEPTFPAVGLVCSGGHTALYRVSDWNEIERIGATRDDAVGEAYDKVAAILGLAYPGGPVIDRLARDGDAAKYKFPRSLLGRDSLDFSFSGLKTAVLYAVRGIPGRDDPKPPPTEAQVRDLAASFQEACVDTLVTKLRRAVRATGARSVIVGGGVSANTGLRAALSEFDVPVHFPEQKYCTDNAAMIAGLAHVHLREGKTSGLDLDAVTFSEIPLATDGAQMNTDEIRTRKSTS